MNLHNNFKDANSYSTAESVLKTFASLAIKYDLEPFESEGFTEARRILDLADQVDRASWNLKKGERPYNAIASELIDGTLDPTAAVIKVNDAEHQAKLNEGQYTPAGRLAMSLRAAATPHVRNQDEKSVLDWLTPPFDQAVANASHYADIVDSIIGTEPRRDPTGVRSVEHHWSPRNRQLRGDRRLARAWEDLATALDEIYGIAGSVHKMRAIGVIRAPLTDTRDTVWAQVWATIPQGAFTGDTRPGRVREFYRAHRHQHQLALATAQELDRNAVELPDDHDQIAEATIAMHHRMADTGYQSVFPSR